MNFKEALQLLQKGHRVIAKGDMEAHDQMWLSPTEDGIDFMNEPWQPSAKTLLEYMDDEWIDVDSCCEYHDHGEDGKCVV